MREVEQRRTWLITGCSTGLGRALAEYVLGLGDLVVVTARKLDDIKDFEQRYPDQVRVLELDVSKAESITALAAQIEASKISIDVLVNNAGYGYLAAIEEGEDDEIRALFETNTFGLFALTRAILPGMRTRATGHIVNITSVAGLVGNPGSGYYAASKFAVEGFSEALAKEVRPLGIDVTIVEPGPFRTDWAGRSLVQSKRIVDAYSDTSGKRRSEVPSYSGLQMGDPARAAAAIVAAVNATTPPLHLILGQAGLANVQRKLDGLRTDIENWKGVTMGADFPKGSELPAK